MDPGLKEEVVQTSEKPTEPTEGAEIGTDDSQLLLFWK